MEMKSVKNLFLVDDDEIFTFLAERTIKETNLVDHIQIFSNGQEAIEFLEKAAENVDLLPEVILLDINMPILDGWGFLEEFILLKPSLPQKVTIYMVSTSISPFDLERAKDISEVLDYIIKPISKADVVRILGNL